MILMYANFENHDLNHTQKTWVYSYEIQVMAMHWVALAQYTDSLIHPITAGNKNIIILISLWK